MEKRRSAYKCVLFGDCCELKTNILPTYEDVMKYYEWMRQTRKLSAKEPTFSEIATNVVSTIEDIWKTASIPTVTSTRVTQKLKSYHLKCKNLLKSIKRLTPEKKASFQQSSKSLFDISACKCKDLLQCNCPKDKKVPKLEQLFLIDQRTCRKMMIGGIDVTVTKKIKKSLKRKQVQEQRYCAAKTTSTVSVESPLSLSPMSSPQPERRSSSDAKETTQSFNNSVNKKKEASCNDFPAFSKICDRYGISYRAAAAIASSVLHDVGSDVGVIDRSKVRRQRSKNRQKLLDETKEQEVSALYFDGRKDKTSIVIKKGDKRYRKEIVEEHISIIKEPGSIYLGYVVPSSGSAKGIETAIVTFITEEGFCQDQITAVGCDGTNVNTGKHAGIIRLLEKRLKKPLQWIVCLLHMNELPLRHLFMYLDGCTSGPKSYTGPIGKALETCELLPVKRFQRIEVQMLPEMATDLSTDQKYLHNIVSAVISGNFPEGLENKSPGKLSHARWLTRANRILRLYVSTDSPSSDLVILATFIVKVYAPSWFLIKNKPSCKDGTRHLFHVIKSSRYLPDNLKEVVDPVIQRNAYFAHPENVLLGMITDDQKHIRELAARRILKARSGPENSIPRVFEVPQLNFNVSQYFEIINWQMGVSEPPILKHLTDKEISEVVESGGKTQLTFTRLPCHTQAVERAVKITTEAATSQCTRKDRLGAIKAKLVSRSVMPKFDTKAQFSAI